MGPKSSFNRTTLAQEILFAADFSESCDPCLAYATEFARLTGGTIITARVDGYG